MDDVGGPDDSVRPSDFRIEIKKRSQAGFELLLDFLFATLQNVHRDARLAAILEPDSCVAHLRDLFCRQQAQAIYQSQICHMSIVKQEESRAAWGDPSAAKQNSASADLNGLNG